MRKASIYLSIILCIFLVLGPLNIVRRMMYPQGTDGSSTRIHMNTGNTIRIPGQSPEDISTNISKILFPAVDDGSRPNGIIIIQTDKWQDVMAALPLAHIYNCPVIKAGNTLSPDIVSYINNSRPSGIQALNGTQLLLVSKSASLQSILGNTKYKIRSIIYGDTDSLQKQVYKLPEVLKGQKYGFVLSESDPLMSIPASTWVVHQGGAVLYANSENKLYSSAASLLNTGILKKLYIFGNKIKIPEEITKKFKIAAENLTAKSPEQLSVKFAKFNDSENSVGWGFTPSNNDIGHNFVLCSKNNPMTAVLSSQLALGEKNGPILLTEGKKLSTEIENYLWGMKPAFGAAPSEGSYNNIWVVGNENLINYNTQARANFTQEMEPHEINGTGGLEVVAILIAASSLFGALWAAIHLFLRMRHLTTLTKLMWILVVLLLGPVGLLLYVVSYRVRPYMMIQGITIWKRPLWNQTAVATIIGIAFGSGTMVVASFILSVRGIPVVPNAASGGLAFLGSPVFIRLIISFAAALVINTLVFMPQMIMEAKKVPYPKALRGAILPAAVSLISAGAAAMLVLWWIGRAYLPVLPEEDEILWWGMFQFSVLIGGIIAYIPNWIMVRHGKIPGTA